MVEELIEFDIERISPSIIMVAGVGGGGSNAVNHMYELGIADVTFMVCNTDRQALFRSPVPIKVKLGEHLTEGLGAGNNPERGRAAALESLDDIISVFKREGTKMVFVTAGMGGGTGTGAAPIIAKAAKELGILTVAIVTLPFKTEGKKRTEHALTGIEELKKNVDSLLVINNENIQDMYGKLTLTEAFGKADDILATAAKGIAEIITGDGMVNVDFADVKTVMSDSGIALMGSARGNGENRAIEVADMAMSSPLLNHNNIVGAKNILINITSGNDEIRLEETGSIIEYIQDKAGNDANIIWGAGRNSALGDDIEVTIIATGFENVSPAEDHVVNDPVSAFEPVRSPASADDVIQTDKKRWRAPLEPTVHPFEKRRIVVQPDREGEALKNGGVLNPAAKSATQGGVIDMPTDNRYGDIENMVNVPAYVRRKVKFIQDVSEDGAKGPKVSIKDDPAQEKKPASNSLFD